MRIWWLGRVISMEGERMAQEKEEKIGGRMDGHRSRGRPRRRWIKDLADYLAKISVGNRSQTEGDRNKWRWIILEAVAHLRLYCWWKKWKKKRIWAPRAPPHLCLWDTWKIIDCIQKPLHNCLFAILKYLWTMQYSNQFSRILFGT